MNSLWQRLTLANAPLAGWLDASYLHRIVGSLRAWREQSWLMRWGDEIGAILTSLVLLLSPFEKQIPGDTQTIGLVLIAVAMFWLLLTISDNRESRITPIHVTLLGFWGVSAISTGLSPARAAASEGFVKVSLYILLFVMLARLCRSPRIRNWFVAIYLHVSIAISAYGINQSIYGAKQLATWVDAESTLAKTTRAYSFLGNPNVLAGYIMPAIAFSVAAFFVWRTRTQKALALFIAAVNLWCLQATYCRGAWIGVMVGVIVAAILIYYWFRPVLPKFWRSWALPVIIGGILAVSALAIIAIPNLRDRVLSIFSDRQDSSNNFRIEVWSAVRKMIQERPFLGIGPGDRAFKKMYPIYQTSPKFSALGAYSVFLETIVEIGYIGFAFFIWAVVVTFNCGVEGLKRLRTVGDPQAFWLMAAIASAAATLCQGATDTVWYRPPIQTLWWLTVGIIASFYQAKPDSETL